MPENGSLDICIIGNDHVPDDETALSLDLTIRAHAVETGCCTYVCGYSAGIIPATSLFTWDVRDTTFPLKGYVVPMFE